MTAPTKNSSVAPKTPTLVIDSSIIRKHLFKGWSVLNRIGAIARVGKINLCIPWVVEKEVLSGIENHVDELTGQEAFLSSVRQIAQHSSDPDSIRLLCDKFEVMRPQICGEAKSRFQHWLDASQADRPSINPDHTKRVFDAYFSGQQPFDKPKNREHIPDAFIYNVVLDLIAGGGEVWFLAADGQLCNSLRQNEKVRVYTNFYPLFEELQVPFDFKQQQALSLKLDIDKLCQFARASLGSELRGQVLRYGGGEPSIAPRIYEVIEVRALMVDQQSVMHFDDSALLIAFEAEVVIRIAERSTENRIVVEKLSVLNASIRGHFSVVLDNSNANNQAVKSIEVDDFEVGAMDKIAGSENVQAIAPQPQVESYYQDSFDQIIRKKHNGLIVVVGSTLRNRRLVAEHIIAAALKNNEVALLGFPPILEKHLPSHDCTGEPSLSSLWDKARDAELNVLGLSSESANWAMESIHYLLDADCLIVATMKSANNRSPVVRYLAGLPNGRNYLEHLLAVAWIQDVTPEKVNFCISQHGGWGDGAWETILERDEMLQRSSRKTEAE